MQIRLISVCCAALLLSALAGCGQAGPLYLPGDAAPQSAPQTGAQAPPAPANNQKTQ